MDDLDRTFPQHILAAAPAPDRCGCPAEYLDHVLDACPDRFAEALPFASHDNLAELVMIRRWTRARAEDRQAFHDISVHPETDFWIVLAIMLRAFPAPGSGPAEHKLADHLIRLINDGSLRMRYSETPIISTRSIEIYNEMARTYPGMQIEKDIVRAAERHAAWLARGNKQDSRFALFDGMPIFAVNRADQD